MLSDLKPGTLFLIFVIYAISLFLVVKAMSWYYKARLKKVIDEIHRQYRIALDKVRGGE